MNKPLFGLLLGGLLGVFDGLSALLSAPETRPEIVGIVIGSTLKGVIAGVVIGLVARKFHSLLWGMVIGILVGAALAFPIAYMQGKYYLEIMLPGSLVGLIVGFATQRHVERRVSPGTVSMLIVLSAGSVAAASAGPASSQPESAKAAFERIKALAGTWEGTAGDAANAMPVKLVYELVGQGSAVKETLFPGTPHEMLTVYHLDGPSLVLTHYCAAGNQPRMKLARTVAGPPYELFFDFTGGSNMDAGKDMHMHSAHIRLLDGDRMESEWTSYQGGKAADVEKFTVSRKK